MCMYIVCNLHACWSMHDIGQCACTRLNLWIYVHSHVCPCTHAPTKTHRVETTWEYCVCTKVCDAFMRLIPNECQRRTTRIIATPVGSRFPCWLFDRGTSDCARTSAHLHGWCPVRNGPTVLIFPNSPPKTVRTTVRGLEFVGFFVLLMI